ncbi:MAG TPA: hypothetical protein VFN05_02105 [Actinomycetes bacterium]|nr:hypothetical protein [Actinomycetes bacterium]
MQQGDVRDWPYGALLPWARSRSLWHAWGDQMADALAEAGRALGRDDWVRVAVGEAGRFTPHLLAQGGPENGWLPAPTDRVQIAYSADATLQNLLRTAAASAPAGGLPAPPTCGWRTARWAPAAWSSTCRHWAGPGRQPVPPQPEHPPGVAPAYNYLARMSSYIGNGAGRVAVPVAADS